MSGPNYTDESYITKIDKLTTEAIAYRLRIAQLEAVIRRADMANCDLRIREILNEASINEAKGE